MARALSGARLLVTQGLGHRKILRDAEVIATVTEFMTGSRAHAGDATALEEPIERELFDREARARRRA